MTTNYLPGWGYGQWGYSLWGSVVSSQGAPQIVSRYPTISQTDVPADVAITVQIFDVNYDLDIPTVVVLLNNVIVYDGTVGFSPGYTGKFTYIAGIASIIITPFVAFEYDQLVTVSVYARDTELHDLNEAWSFTIQPNPTCYVGNQPSALEIAIQQSLGTYLNLEPFRVLMLNIATRNSRKAVTNAGNKAARVIYQLAYATELSTVLNAFDNRNEAALATKVCERTPTLVIDQELLPRKKELAAAIASLRIKGSVSDSYIRAFTDYLDSSLYTYRVSLVANLLLLGKSLELNNG